jgi:hypothetical protein
MNIKKIAMILLIATSFFLPSASQELELPVKVNRISDRVAIFR